MTRPLLLIAAVGFVTSMVCWIVVAALGPIRWENFSVHGGDGWAPGPAVSGVGPEITREIAWPGDEKLTVTIPAEVTYTQGPAARITVTGPRGAVEQVEVDGDRIRFARRVHSPSRLKIAVTAPAVEEFTLAGSQSLTIDAFDRPRLEVTIAGSGEVRASGRTREARLRIAGSGDGDFGALASETADVEIAGSGDATVAPTQSLDVDIAGSGDVTLLTRPPEVDSSIAGSGRIIQAPPPAPAPTVSPTSASSTI